MCVCVSVCMHGIPFPQLHFIVDFRLFLFLLLALFGFILMLFVLFCCFCWNAHRHMNIKMPHTVSSDDNSHSIHVQHLLLGSKSNPNRSKKTCNQQMLCLRLPMLLLLFWGVFIYISAMQIAWSMKMRGLMAVGKRACVSHFKSHAITKFAWFCLEWLQTIMVITTSNKRCTYTHMLFFIAQQVEE